MTADEWKKQQKDTARDNLLLALSLAVAQMVLKDDVSAHAWAILHSAIEKFKKADTDPKEVM